MFFFFMLKTITFLFSQRKRKDRFEPRVFQNIVLFQSFFALFHEHSSHKILAQLGIFMAVECNVHVHYLFWFVEGNSSFQHVIKHESCTPIIQLFSIIPIADKKLRWIAILCTRKLLKVFFLLKTQSL